MNTFAYNTGGEKKYCRAVNMVDAERKIFFKILKLFGRVDMSKVDVKQVRNPGEVKSQRSKIKSQNGLVRRSESEDGNKVFDNLRHI